MPDSTPKMVVETRIDPRTLAALHRYYKEHGQRASNKSELLRIAIEHLHRSLLNSGMAPTTDVEAALDYLADQGLTIGKRKLSKTLPIAVANVENDHQFDEATVEELKNLELPNDSSQD